MVVNDDDETMSRESLRYLRKSQITYTHVILVYMTTISTKLHSVRTYNTSKIFLVFNIVLLYFLSRRKIQY